MSSDPCQRWKCRRDSYRPAGEVIDTASYGVEAVEESAAKAFVEAHHYSGSYPAARVRVGLYRSRKFWAAELVGVCVFGVPAQRRTVPAYASGVADGVVLSRFVLRDEVPANGETWFLARAFRVLRRARPEVGVVISYSDPLRRVAVDGSVVLPGHVGTIYQAFNGQYLGRSGSETLHLSADGRIVSRRALSKIKLEERGAAYAYRQLLEMGAPPRNPLEESSAYVARAMASTAFRRVRHPGNHVYAWPLSRSCTLAPSAGPYPKVVKP